MLTRVRTQHHTTVIEAPDRAAVEAYRDRTVTFNEADYKVVEGYAQIEEVIPSRESVPRSASARVDRKGQLLPKEV